MVWIGLGLMQPLTVVIGWAILGAHHVLGWGMEGLRSRRLDLRRGLQISFELGLAFLAPLPLVAYTFFSFYSDPFLRGWTNQNLILSPPPWDYLLAFGLALLPAAWAALDALRSGERDRLLLATWLVLFPILAYAPYNLQRRLPEGVWVALVILALLKIEAWPRRVRRTSLVMFSSGILSTLLFFTASLGAVFTRNVPLYRPAAEVEAFQYLAENAQAGDVVLAPYKEPDFSANALPAWAPVHTVIGHGPESVNLAGLEPRVERFFQNEGELSLLEEFSVRFILVNISPYREGGTQREEANAPGYEMVFRNDSYLIYKQVNACRC
jgi:hypothetical protein